MVHLDNQVSHQVAYDNIQVIRLVLKPICIYVNMFFRLALCLFCVVYLVFFFFFFSKNKPKRFLFFIWFSFFFYLGKDFDKKKKEKA